MRRALGLAAIAVLFSAAVPRAQQAEDQAVRAVINQYFKGHATGSGPEMRKAFLPTARIEGIRQGVFTSWTVDQYVGGFQGKPAADEPSRKRAIEVVSISG